MSVLIFKDLRIPFDEETKTRKEAIMDWLDDYAELSIKNEYICSGMFDAILCVNGIELTSQLYSIHKQCSFAELRDELLENILDEFVVKKIK